MSVALDQLTKLPGDLFKPVEIPVQQLTQKLMDSIQYNPSDVDDIKNHKFRIISGYANKDTLDRVRDQVEPQAFAKSLPTYMKNPILRYNHQTGAIIGKVLETKITSKGLWVEAQVFRGDPEADRIWKLIVQGGLRAFSVYGIIKKKNLEHGMDGKSIQRVSEFDLHEIAIVDLPAHPDSLFQITKKSVGETMTEPETEEITQKEMLNETVQDAPVQAGKEVGNEQIGSENTVLTKLGEISSFQQQQLEVMITFAETQNEIVQKLLTMETATAKTADAGFEGDGEETGFEEADAEEDDFSFEGEDEGMEKPEPAEKSIETAKVDIEAKPVSDPAMDIVMKQLKDITDANTAMQKRFEELTAKSAEIAETETEIVGDVNVEEAVQKAVKNTPPPQGEKLVEKSFETDDDRMMTHLKSVYGV